MFRRFLSGDCSYSRPGQPSYTGYRVRDGHIFGPHGSTQCWVEYGHIHGPCGYTRYWIDLGHIHGPGGETGCWIDGNGFILGIAENLPWH
jgi:hypothetical protein